MIKQLVANTETQHRALRLRIYPNPEQTILINKTFGYCRQIYNNRLFERNEFYQNIIKNEPDKWKSSKNENNCQVVKADRLFASSQICHCCGYKNPITKNLSIRSWICPNCNTNHIRDVNAALNLKQNAIKNVRRGASKLMSAEGVEDLARLALQIGASAETENLTGDGQNVITSKYVMG